MFVTPSNIRELSHRLAEAVGEEFVVRHLDSYEPDGLSEFERRRLDVRAHPMARQWKNLGADVAKTEKSGTLQLSEESLYLLDLIDALSVCSGKKGLSRILDDLRNPSQYHSAAYELRILSQFISAGTAIEISEEGAAKSSDFQLVSALTDLPVGIECKSLQDNAFIDHLIWESALLPISRALAQHKRNWRVRIVAQTLATEALVQQVINDLSRLTRDDLLGYHSLAEGSVGVECVALAPAGKKFEGGIRHNSQGNIVDIVCKVENRRGHFLYSDPKIVEIQPFESDDQSKSILNGLKKAGDQLTRGRPNIVYFQVPYRKGRRLQAVVDNAFEPVSDALRRNHSRINLCVITGQYPTPILRDGDSPLVWTHTVVPNDSATNSLPRDIVPIGTHDLDLDLNPDEGTVVVEFGLDSPWSSQIGRSIFSHCSRDGHYQLRIWHSLDGKFRVDVRTPTLGRLVGSGNPVFQSKDVHKLGASWAAGGLSIYVDGTKVA